MHYVVQTNLFSEEGHDRLIASMDAMGLSYELVKLLPFVDEIPAKTDRKDVWCFGALKMAKLAPLCDWQPGVIMTANHDFEVYRGHYGDNLLNNDSVVTSLGDPGLDRIEGSFFVRPTLDTKSLNGTVCTAGEWAVMRDRLIHNGLSPETSIQVAATKHVSYEHRFWVVGGRVVTGSQYKRRTRIDDGNPIDPELQEFAQAMVDKFQIAKAFVIDVCRTPDGLRIVECGCINCAGFYRSDVQRLLVALEEEFE